MEDGAWNIFDVEKLRADDTKRDLLEEVPLAQILGSDFVVRVVGRGKRRYGPSTGGTFGYSSMTSPRQARGRPDRSRRPRVNSHRAQNGERIEAEIRVRCSRAARRQKESDELNRPHEPDTVRIAPEHGSGRLQREPRLAKSPDARQCQQAGVVEQAHDLVHFPLAGANGGSVEAR